MGTSYRIRARYALTALAMVLTVSPPASAQIAGRDPVTEGATPNDRSDTAPAPGGAPDVSITTHDAVGEFGVALPVEINFIHAQRVIVEAINLFGLPHGTTISDSTNTFSPSSDSDDVDISSWDLSKLQITQRDERTRNFPIAVAAIWTSERGGRLEVTASRFNVTFVQGNRDRPSGAGGEPGSSEQPAAQIRETVPSAQPVATVARPDAPASGVFVPEVHVAPLRDTAAVERPAAPTVADGRSAVEAKAAALPRPAVAPQPAPRADPLVERAKGLIRLGDISGARLLLERAQARNASNATFLLAQTWDPAMLRTWKVRGLRADPDLARRLYAKAAGEERSDERLLAATGR
ncbi:hypothetical protein [Methylobacterium sp. J-070]|uniref:hypothetical protein n=1 Tax=Methylobacterium sp. J-070 TaxID=2836650 RepID=UPI001FBA6DA0|nr:hypothetical protein [Methylobacterium sp. J-070]MCJ2049185.1 hypothetical protein [Methylobacterium sp. J-070]